VVPTLPPPKPPAPLEVLTEAQEAQELQVKADAIKARVAALHERVAKRAVQPPKKAPTLSQGVKRREKAQEVASSFERKAAMMRDMVARAEGHLEKERKATALRNQQNAAAEGQRRVQRLAKVKPVVVPTLREIKEKERENVQNGNTGLQRELDAVRASEKAHQQAYAKEIASKDTKPYSE